MNSIEESNHSKFLAHLDESQNTVWRVAAMLRERGYNVTIPCEKRAASHSQWRDNVDGGDLFINQRIEVKRLSVNFTCAADWPFGDKFIVCAKHAFDSAAPKPYAYIIVSADHRYAATALCSDASSWSVEVRQDSRYTGVSQEFYFCPLPKVHFHRIP